MLKHPDRLREVREARCLSSFSPASLNPLASLTFLDMSCCGEVTMRG